MLQVFRKLAFTDVVNKFDKIKANVMSQHKRTGINFLDILDPTILNFLQMQIKLFDFFIVNISDHNIFEEQTGIISIIDQVN